MYTYEKDLRKNVFVVYAFEKTSTFFHIYIVIAAAPKMQRHTSLKYRILYKEDFNIS